MQALKKATRDQLLIAFLFLVWFVDCFVEGFELGGRLLFKAPFATGSLAKESQLEPILTGEISVFKATFKIRHFGGVLISRRLGNKRKGLCFPWLRGQEQYLKDIKKIGDGKLTEAVFCTSQALQHSAVELRICLFCCLSRGWFFKVLLS